MSQSGATHSERRDIPARCSMVSIIALRGTGAGTRLLTLCRASDYLNGVWSYVAGHVEVGESGWQAARRELAEETGLVPQLLYATSFCEQFYNAANDCVELVPAFVARVADSDEDLVRLNPEHSAWRWVSFDEARSLFPFGSQRDLLAHVEREFVERAPSPWLRVAGAGSVGP